MTEKTNYIEGDFIFIANTIEPADIVIMDKVVCCYPDADSLIHHSLEKCLSTYALAYPRKTWYTRLGTQILALIMRLVSSDFRPYVHDPDKIEKWITEQGYKKINQAQTTVWLTQVYKK